MDCNPINWKNTDEKERWNEKFFKIVKDFRIPSNSLSRKKRKGEEEKRRETGSEIEEKRKEKGKTETQRGNGNKERKGEKKNEVEAEAEGSVGENNFRDIGLVASSSSFSRIFTFHSPLKSAIEFHHRIPPPPPGERGVSSGGEEKKKSPFSILVSTGTKNGETTLLLPL